MTRRTRLRAAVALNAALVVGEALAGVVAHSMGLLSEAGHNLADVAGLVLSLVALRLSLRPPTPSRSFGWHRSTILAAQANAAAVLAVAVLVAYGAVNRLLHPRVADGAIMLGVSLAALLVNGVAAVVLNEHGYGRGDLNMRANLLHMAGDAAASGGVALAGVLVLVLGTRWADPAVSLLIAGLIGIQAVQLVRESSAVLLESTPVDIDIGRLSRAAREVEGVEDIHDLHVWSLSSEVRALSAHLVISGHPTLEGAQATGSIVKGVLAQRFGIAHATLELECETCLDEAAVLPHPDHADTVHAEAALRGHFLHGSGEGDER
ncbi:MAG: cation diffusion facilitator family transporter [Acidimicrobiales bacterium]